MDTLIAKVYRIDLATHVSVVAVVGLVIVGLVLWLILRKK